MGKGTPAGGGSFNGPASARRTRVRQWSATGCCAPVLVGTFVDQALVRLELRHMGRTCFPQLDKVDIKAWRKGEAQ